MSDEKKIIVDEDWKSRVAAEKEQERQEASQTSAAQPAPAAAPAGEPQLPPASFNMLITTLATEAMIGLGQLPHPVTQQFHPDATQARYAIDMLEVLAEKTKGNLKPAEDSFMQDVLHQLRMAFVAVGSQPPAAVPPVQ